MNHNDGQEKKNSNNRYAGFKLLSLQCTQHFCLLPAVKLYPSQRITPWSTTMLLMLKTQGEWGTGCMCCEGHVISWEYASSQRQRQVVDASSAYHACWVKYNQNTATKAYTQLQAVRQEDGKPPESLRISWLRWQKRLGLRNILATWSLIRWVCVLFIKMANAGRSYHRFTHHIQVLWVVLT